MEKKWFTPEEANALLPQIQEELTALQTIKRKFEEGYMRLRRMREQAASAGFRSEMPDPFFELECELEFMQIEARTLIRSIHMKGAQLKDLDLGLVDFPSVLNGKEVLLCWKQGEPKIAYYHGLYDGYGGRKPLKGT